MEYYLAIKKNNVLPFAVAWMDLENIILNETEKDKYCMISLICGIHTYSFVELGWGVTKCRQNEYKWICMQNRNGTRYRKQTCGYQRGQGRQGDKLGVWD